MIEGFGPNNESIGQLLTAASNKRGVQAHGKNADENTIAAFLIGAQHNAFFGVGGWSAAQPESHWSECFDFPLGAPLGPATYSVDTAAWSRSFSKGINASFNARSNKGVVEGWHFQPTNSSTATTAYTNAIPAHATTAPDTTTAANKNMPGSESGLRVQSL